jgi:hypothetical protein
MKVLRFTCAALLLTAPVFAQDEPARRQAVEVAARVPFEKAMKGAPYSAETIVEGTQTLADGNRINKKTTGRVYRDGEGRTRREEDIVSVGRLRTGSSERTGSIARTTISIVDPVAGFSYSLDPENKIAWSTPMGVAGGFFGKVEAAQVDAERRVVLEKMVEARKAGASDEQSKEVLPMRTPPPTPAAGGGGRGGGTGVPTGAAAGGFGGGRARGRTSENVAVGPLERKTIEGVAVEGRKTTTIIPAGQVGNEQPITIVSEEWRSPELNLLVLTRHADPRTGESIYRLENIVRAEPDRSLFMVPPDYTVKQTGIRKMVEQEAARKR